MAAKQAQGRSDPRSDLVAGLAIAGLLLPEAVAYASIGNLPPQAGLAGLFAGLFAYGALGSSRFAVVSATSSSAAFLAAAVASFPGGAAEHAALACGLVLATGALFLLAAAARLGNASGFIARPVLHGFSLGLGMVIALRQVARMAGLHLGTGAFFPALVESATRWREVHGPSLALGIASYVLLRLLSRAPRVPAALAVITLVLAIDFVLPLQPMGIVPVGRVELALPSAALPALALEQWLRLAELAAAMVLVLFAESYGTVRTLALRHGDAVAPNRDLAALGVANLVSGLARGMPVGAGFSATSANEAAGAHSQRAGWVAAAAVLALLLLAMPAIERTPEPVLAAVVLHAISHSLSTRALRPYFAWRRDRVIAIFALAVVLLFGVLDGLLAGIAASIFMMLRDFSGAKVSELGRLGSGHDFVSIALHPHAVAEPGIVVLRPEAPLFFGNAESMFHTLFERAAGARTVVLSLEESPDLDATALLALREFARHLEARGIRLRLARVKEPVRELLHRARLPELPEKACAAWSVDDAVREAKSIR
jgi:SulP family sulfate permease